MVFSKGFNREGYPKGISLEDGYEQMERDRNKNSRGKYNKQKVDFDIARARGVEKTYRTYVRRSNGSSNHAGSR